MKETRTRSMVKGLTYRALATVATMTVAFLFTGNFSAAVKVGLADSVVKFVLYYLNERGWNLVSWGYVAPEAVRTHDRS
jgi:uncharacterized membrane protein